MSLDGLDVPLSQVEQQLVAWVEEALALRHDGNPSLPPAESAPHVIQSSLVQVRQRLDRIEAILARVTRARGRCRRAAKEGGYIAQDAWDQIIVRMPRRDYEGPKERYAEASLRSFDQQRDARLAERLLDTAEEAYHVIKLAHDGLSSLRYDHVAWLRSFNFESSLER